MMSPTAAAVVALLQYVLGKAQYQSGDLAEMQEMRAE